jgi:hypothetical protein
MIISHKHKFIFIKTSKTAGTSLEITLSAICGREDVVTTISLIDEKARLEMGIYGPRNFDTDPNFTFRTHATALEIKQHVAPEIWNTYFKFCFERNPWDKVISHYYWQKRNKHYPTLQHYLDAGELHNIKGVDHYTIDGEVAVDEIYRYEELDSALAHISQKLGLTQPLQMPAYKAKSQYRDRSLPYRQMFSPAQAKQVADFFVRETKLLSYMFL